MSRPISVAARSVFRDTFSNSSSRSISRAHTPLPDGEENGSLDVNFLSLEELLLKKLESLQALLLQSELEDTENRDSMVANSQDYRQSHAVAMNKNRIQSDHTTIVDIINSLQHPRSEVSSLSREMLLAQLYKLIVTKPVYVSNSESTGVVTEEDVLDLVKILSASDYRSSTEFILLYRSCISLLVSDLDDFGEIVSTDFLASIETLFTDSHNSYITNENKANVITGYCGLLLALYGDTSAFGIDDKVKWMMEYASGFVQSAVTLKTQLKTGDREYSTLMHESDDKLLVSEQEASAQAEAAIAVASLHGVAVLITLLQKGDYLNDLLTHIATEVIEIIDNDMIPELSKAAAKVLALCYELYTYEEKSEDDEDDEEFNYNAPVYEQESILNILNRLANVSSKKIGKKEKNKSSTFKEVANTIQNYTDAEKRTEIYKRTQTGIELLAGSVSSTQIKLSRSKFLPINSWFLYFRLLHMKWLFGFGLHDQLVGNPNVKSLLREPSTEYQLKYSRSDASEYDGTSYGNNARKDTDRFVDPEKKRATEKKKAIENKISEKFDQLEL